MFPENELGSVAFTCLFVPEICDPSKNWVASSPRLAQFSPREDYVVCHGGWAAGVQVDHRDQWALTLLCFVTISQEEIPEVG